MAATIILGASLIAALAVILAQNVLHYREKRDLFNRFMAGDYKTYNHFEKVLPEQMKQQEKILEKKLEEKVTPEVLRAREAARGF